MKEAFDIARLIEKERREPLSAAEQAHLQRWRTASAGNERAYARMTASDFLEKGREQWQHFDWRVAFGRFLQRREQRQRALRLWRRVAVAAAVVIPLVVAVVLYRAEQPWDEQPPLATATDIHPGKPQAILTLADGRTVDFGQEQGDSTLLTDGTRIEASTSGVTYQEGEASDSIVYNRLAIPRGGEFCLTLSDGSRVWLNASTSIRYPVKFGPGERRVYLDGEAYFEVAKDAKRPFHVEFTGAEVTVLGTSFNVKAYADEGSTYTTLVSGSVSVRVGDRQSVIRPGEQMEIDAANGQMHLREVDTTAYTSWRKGRFVFVRQPMESIMQTLARWYNIRVIFLDEAARRVSITGNVRRYATFEMVTDMLEMTGDVHFELKGNDVYISTDTFP